MARKVCHATGKGRGNLWSYSFSQTKHPPLGKGAFAEVFAGHRKCKLSGAIEDVAVKRCALPDRSSRRFKALENEISILKELSGEPHIVHLFSTFVEKSHAHLCFELCSGGDLLKYIRRQPIPISETAIRIAGRQIAAAIEILHEHNIIHRDIKPGNVFLIPTTEAPGFGYITKLGDFGLATRGPADNATASQSMYHSVNQTWCGTPSYMPPEMLFRMRYDKAVDLYGYGALLYQMRTRTTPIRGADIDELKLRMPQRRLLWPAGTTTRFKNLCADLLDNDPAKRPTQLTDHSFFVEGTVDLSVALQEYVVIEEDVSPELETRLRLLKTAKVSEEVVRRGMGGNLTPEDREALAQVLVRFDFRGNSERAAAKGQREVARRLLTLATSVDRLVTLPPTGHRVLAIDCPDDSNHLGTQCEGGSAPVPIPSRPDRGQARFCYGCGAQFQTISSVRCRCGQLRYHMSV
jgi:serine/threonine protein kinase